MTDSVLDDCRNRLMRRVAEVRKLKTERDEWKAKFERLHRAVAAHVQGPMEWHPRACTCSWCDLDRAMKDSPDFKKRESSEERKG